MVQENHPFQKKFIKRTWVSNLGLLCAQVWNQHAQNNLNKIPFMDAIFWQSLNLEVFFTNQRAVPSGYKMITVLLLIQKTSKIWTLSEYCINDPNLTCQCFWEHILVLICIANVKALNFKKPCFHLWF